MAAVGSAVGLGNMWRFPYYTAENGGAAFVILYLMMTVLVGLPIMLAEMTVGRGSQKSPIEAMRHYGGAAWKPMGYMFVTAGFVILAYYSVIAGWTLRYALTAILGGFQGDTAEFYGRVSAGFPALGWHVLFIGLTIFVVARGVKGGIERAASILMPLLFMVVCGLAVYASTLAGAGAGYAYYLRPDFTQVLSGKVLSEATGQAFFSLSLGMGAMLTFASYLPKDSHLPKNSLTVAFADFAVAFTAGLMVFPMIFAFGLSGEVGESTMGALFITLPHAFQEMGGFTGQFVGVLFFGALAVGALTSTISLLEVVTSSIIDTFGWSRRRAAVIMGTIIAALGIPASLNSDILGLMDSVAEGIFLVVGALGVSLFVGYVIKDPIKEASRGAPGWPGFSIWRLLLRVVVPALLAFVLYNRIVDLAATIRDMISPAS
jgi:NSS family neurotransmitter:Na+ symporter